MNSKKIIWIVSELFYPDDTSTGYIMTEIAKSLSQKYEVHVLCASVYDDELKATEQLPNEIHVHRISSWGLDKNKLLSRVLRLLVVSFGMWFFGLQRFKRGQQVFMVTNPAFAIPLFASLKPLKNFRLSILVHDVFPENLIPGGVLKSKDQFAYRIFKKFFNWSYKKADRLFVLGRDMQDLLIEKTEKSDMQVKIIENWADVENIKPLDFSSNPIVKELNLSEKIVLLFAGNLGRLQGLHKLFQIINQVENELLHFVFIGNGAAKEELQCFVKENNLQNVTFLKPMPRTDQEKFLNACHFGIVTLDERFVGLGVPSKSYNIIAAGKPIFYLGNPKTEIFQLIKETKLGIALDPLEEYKVISTLNYLNFDDANSYDMKKYKIREIAEDKFSKNFILQKFVEELDYE